MNRVKKEEVKKPKPKPKEKVSWEKEKEACEPFNNLPKKPLKRGR